MKWDRTSVSRIILYLLFAFLPVQLGTFFFFDFSYIFGVKIDYLAPALYLTDILVFILVLLNIPRLPQKFSSLFFLLCSFVVLNILSAHNPFIAIYRFAKIIEIILLFVVASHIQLNYKNLLIILLASSVVQLILGLLQISYGSSMQGLWYFLGERNFNLSTPTIAKVSMQGVEILRAYGSFSHPNSLGGFFTLLYTYILFSPSYTHHKILKYTSLAVMTLLVVLSFSKIAIVTYLLVSSYYAIKDGTKSCYICSFSKIFVAICIAFIFLQAKGDSHTVEKRMYLNTSAFHIFAQHLWTGTGIGNYLYAQSKIPNPYPYHFLEPVHNIVFLAVTELGLPLFLLMILVLKKTLNWCAQNTVAFAMIGVVLFTGMFDHYWLTLQQNILLLPLLLALLKNEGKYDKIERT